MNIPFSPPDISELEIQYVTDALRSGWITTGPRVKELEKKLAGWVGTGKAVCLSSQTAAAETSLRILGIGEGDEVITCAYTYTASASVVLHVGAKLVLVDCTAKPGTLEMDYDALEAAITEKTKAIIPVDLARSIKGTTKLVKKGCPHRCSSTKGTTQVKSSSINAFRHFSKVA